MKTRFVDYLWDDAKAAALDPVERLIYRSNLLGSDQRITNTGGGNTSSKLQQTDPLAGDALLKQFCKTFSHVFSMCPGPRP